MAGIKRKSFRDDSSLGAAEVASAAQGSNDGVNARRPSVSPPEYANSSTHTNLITPATSTSTAAALTSTNNLRGRGGRARSRGSKTGSFSSRGGGGGHQSPTTTTTTTSPMNNGHRRTPSSISPAANPMAVAEEEEKHDMSPPRPKRACRAKVNEHDDAHAASNGTSNGHRNGNVGKGSASTSPVSLRSTRQSAKIAAGRLTPYDGNGDDSATAIDVMPLDPPSAPPEVEQSSPSSGSSGPTSSFPPPGHLILKLNFNRARSNGNGNNTTGKDDKSVSPMVAAGTPNSHNDNGNDGNGDNSSPENGMKVSPSTASSASAADSQPPDASLEPSLSRLVTPQPTATRERAGTSTPTSVTSRTNGTGRGRGGFRGRARGGRRGGATRGTGVGRGRYPRNGRGRGGRLQSLDPESTTSPIPAVRNLKERQRDLERMFRRVAQAQRFALTNLASRTEEQLIKDPNAHKRCAEWEMINCDIDRRFEQRIEQLKNERDLCVEEENILFEANKRRIEDWAKYNAGHIQRDLFLALQGEFISKLEELFYGGSNPTEPQEINEDDSEAISAEIEDSDLVKRTFVRGFNSTTVREPKNAQLVDTALYRWDWLSKLIKDPVQFHDTVETRLLEIKEEDERKVEAETAREKAREDDAAAVQRFESLAQICSERLETYDRTQKEEKPSDNLAALADVASHEKPDGGKSSDETLIAEGISSEERTEEEIDEHGRRVRRHSKRTRRSIDEGRRARLAEEPRPFQLPPPGYAAGYPPGPPLHASHLPPSMYHHPHAPPPILPPPPSHYRPGMQLAPLRFLEENKQHMPPGQPIFPPYHHGPPPPPMTMPENAPPPYRINNPHQRVLPQPLPGHPLYPVSAPLPPAPGPPPSGHYAPIPLPASGPLYPGPPPPSGALPPVPPPGEHERRASLTGRRLLPAYSQAPLQPQTAPAGPQPPSSVPPGPALPPPLHPHPHPHHPPPSHVLPEHYPPRHDPYYRLPPQSGPAHHHPHGPPPPPGSYGPTPYHGPPLPPGLPHEAPPHPSSSRAPPPPPSHSHSHHPQHSPYTSPYGYDPVFYPRNPYHMYPPPGPYPPRHEHHYPPQQGPPPPPPQQQQQQQQQSPAASHTPTSGPPPPGSGHGSDGRTVSGPRVERMPFPQRPPVRLSEEGRHEEY